MTDKSFPNIVLAASFAGISFWLIGFSSLMYKSLIRGSVPFDVLAMIFPVLVFSWMGGLVFCLPLLILAEKLKINSPGLYIMGGPVASLLTVFVVAGTGLNIFTVIVSIISGALGGYVFSCLETRAKG